jgi:ribosome-associated protein
LTTRKRNGDVKLRASHAKKEPSGKTSKKKPPRPKPKPKRRPALPPIASHDPPPRSAPHSALREAPPPPSLRRPRLDPIPAVSVASDSARRLAIEIAAAALEKKAVGLEILDVAGRVDYADFLVLMSGRSDRQVAALADGIEETLRAHGRRPQSVEGRSSARWILMDFSDVVVHVFLEEARSQYDIESLWEDAHRLPAPA